MAGTEDIENTTNNTRVAVGDRAPDFALPNASGEIVKLSDFTGTRNIVLYFYPMDETRGCTAEACSFRDNYEVFKEAGAEVIGVSSDSEASHASFAAHHRLPFILLSDRGGALRKRYGVQATMGVIPGRVTYVIDKQRIVRHVFVSQANIGGHIKGALEALRALPA
jgi:thioredoxin-dependent peroxiredoxin